MWRSEGVGVLGCEGAGLLGCKEQVCRGLRVQDCRSVGMLTLKQGNSGVQTQF